ncbi:Hsp20/alpha crystallin family protein [Marinobacterium aestuariivivens]|uniref:Hsp20/alpha crystallin family protein n=1 Tax=Marinobacterium aestuariivivens TaxID=1698799 RepID=A0ABW2A9Y7_9GAMM
MFGNWIGFDADLFGQLERMRREMDQLFGDGNGASGIRSVAAGTFPAINVGGSPEQVDVYVFAPGIDPKQVDISLQQNLLTVSGERSVSHPESAQFYRRERFNGKFRRVLSLPEDVDPDRVTARYRDGVLHIQVQRREELKPRRIEVQ